LEVNGFKIISATVTGLLPGNSFFSMVFSNKISLRIYSGLKRISPGLFGYQLLYTARLKRSIPSLDGPLQAY